MNNLSQHVEGVQINVSGNLLIINNRTSIPLEHRLSSRSQIDEFSASSSLRMRRFLREFSGEYSVMVTLTYPLQHELDGRVSKEHLKRMLQEMRRYTEKGGKPCDRWSCFWFMEFQSRGAVHFHMFTTHRYPKEWMARTWFRIVDSEDNRHLVAGTRIETIRSGRGGTISYACKYAAKQAQKKVPEILKNFGRFWGVWGYKVRVAAATFVPTSNAGLVKLKKLKKTVERAEKAGFLRPLVLPSACSSTKVYKIMDNEVKRSIFAWIERIEMWNLAQENNIFFSTIFDNGGSCRLFVE